MSSLSIADRKISSRLFLGTGKFASPELMAESIALSEAEIVTLALKRVDLKGDEDNLIQHVNGEKNLIMINTSGASTAEEALRLANLARKAGFPDWIKVEVHPEPRYLMPDPIETLKACELLVKEGFTVLPYIHADPILALRCEEAGAAAVMPLGAAIGSNRGLQTTDFLEMIIEQLSIPVVVDAGLGAPSHAAAAMEMGADAVLVNTAIATAGNPKEMAIAFKEAVVAGRRAFEAKLPSQSKDASASSPLTGFLK
jgi:thiazole synthase